MVSESLVVRPYQPGDEVGILRLFNEVFAEDDPNHRARTLAEWRWEFQDNPAGRQIVVACEPSGRIVAQYACLPALANLRGETVCIGQGIDSVVHRDYRRGLKREGAFLRTARAYFEWFGKPEVNAFGYGFPNRKAFAIGVRMLGYVPVHAPVTSLARNLFNFRDDVAVGRDAAPLEIVEVRRFDERMDRLWARLEPEFPMAIRRTSAYLNWRYADCPLAETHAFAAVEGGEYRAVAVVRPNWMGPPILAIQDWIVAPHDVPAAAALLARVVRYAREHGQPRIEMWLPPTSSQYDAVLARGFSAEPSPFNLCIKVYDPRVDPAYARAHWYYGIGDSDVF